MIQPSKIIISRTDSIGDVVLTLPLAGILKEKFPDAHVIFFGNTYTKPILECSEHIDEIWEYAAFSKLSLEKQITFLKKSEADTFIHVFPRKDLARVVKKAKIKHRIGTSHRLYHLLTCNFRPNFTRKKSDLHEAQLNTKLLAPLGITQSYSLDELTHYSGFTQLPDLPEKFSSLISPDRKNIVLHCKSQGSAVEWGVEKFVSLATSLDPTHYSFFFTGTEKESAFFRHLLPDQKNIVDLSGKMSLDELIAFISKMDGLVAASTGPLHIAGVCNVQTIGLFSSVRPIHAGRWRPLGNDVKILEDKKNSDFSQPLSIDLRVVVQELEMTPKK